MKMFSITKPTFSFQARNILRELMTSLNYLFPEWFPADLMLITTTILSLTLSLSVKAQMHLLTPFMLSIFLITPLYSRRFY